MIIKTLKSRIIRKKIYIYTCGARELFKLLHAKNEHRELLEARIVRVNAVNYIELNSSYFSLEDTGTAIEKIQEAESFLGHNLFEDFQVEEVHFLSLLQSLSPLKRKNYAIISTKPNAALYYPIDRN